MTIVFLQLCVTVGVAATFMFVQPLKARGWLAGRGCSCTRARSEGGPAGALHSMVPHVRPPVHAPPFEPL